MNKDITYDRLHEVLDYNLETGIFNWKERLIGNGRRFNFGGKEAGCLHPDGYVRICVDRKLYIAHRLAWLFVYGYMPENDLDHKNQVRDANWIDNLREVSRSCNLRNSKMPATNTSGIKGVGWYLTSQKWRAQITINQKLIHLGHYTSKLDAAKARHNAEIKYNWSVCNTKQSSAYRYIQSKQEGQQAAR